jgi:hypothetical protein
LCLLRFVRSTRDLLNTLARIADGRAGFRSLAKAWADAAPSRGRLMLAVQGGLSGEQMSKAEKY